MIRSVWLFAIALGLSVSGCVSGLAAGPADRPGLGTSFGESRASPVEWVAFERDDPERPLAVATLYYDDVEGIRDMARGADPFGPPEAMTVGGGPLRVRLVDAWGAPLPTFSHAGRTYVAGRAGQRYAIEIENRSPRRVEAVATVDGLDVFDGGPGSFDKRGYVLDAGQTYRIDGFRQSLHEVAAFRFGDVSESYAAATGDDANVGVIGVAFFAERRRDADPFPGGW